MRKLNPLAFDFLWKAGVVLINPTDSARRESWGKKRGFRGL